jgi:hypothetical protein
MSEDRDLLPWILGALSMAAVAMAATVGLTGRSAPAHASGETTSFAPTLATAELNPKMQSSAVAPGAAPAGSAAAPGAPTSPASSSAAQPFPAPPSAQNLGSAQAQPAPAANLPGNQIWECTINGVKTFSNTRCGSAAVLREVGPTNVMEASPPSTVHWYGPDSSGAPDYYDPSPPQPSDNSYPVVVGVPYLDHRRPQRAQQQNHHDRGHPRRN